MIRSLLVSVPLVLGMMMVTAGCNTASSVCQTICECEHCNKYSELDRCRKLEKAEAQADAYECGDAYAAFLDCTASKGTCDAERADYTTAGTGTCTNNTCELSGMPCSTSADCVGEGTDLCEKEQEAVTTCIDKASGYPNF